MIKIITIVGARPQFIKAAALSNNLKNHSQIEEVIVHTGQHYDKMMSDVFFKQLQIPEPQYRFESGGKSQGAMTGYQLTEIEKIVLKEKPDWVVVYGDTNSTLAGALAASKLHVPIAHIEAGLRSYNMQMPEEINRILTDRLSTLLFCPTSNATRQLKEEGFEKFDTQIEMVGDIMFDSLKLVSSHLDSVSKNENPYVLCTLHRAENTDNEVRLKKIFKALNTIAEEISIQIPLHPRTKNKIEELNIRLHPNLLITSPLSYIEFISALQTCDVVISDSGGIQKEAYFLEKNCIILRDETEWTELIENKNNVLVGSETTEILDAFRNRKNLKQDFSTPFYGKGDTAKAIIHCLLSYTVR